MESSSLEDNFMHKLFDLLEEPITKEQLVKEEKLDEDANIYKIMA